VEPGVIETPSYDLQLRALRACSVSRISSSPMFTDKPRGDQVVCSFRSPYASTTIRHLPCCLFPVT